MTVPATVICSTKSRIRLALGSLPVVTPIVTTVPPRPTDSSVCGHVASPFEHSRGRGPVHLPIDRHRLDQVRKALVRKADRLLHSPHSQEANRSGATR